MGRWVVVADLDGECRGRWGGDGDREDDQLRGEGGAGGVNSSSISIATTFMYEYEE